MEKLRKLTPDQEAQLGPWADRWIQRALEVRPADREIAERGIRGYYRVAGLREPRRIVWTTSPIAVAFAGPLAASIVGRGAVSGAVHRAVGGAVYEAVNEAVRDAVYVAVDSAAHDVVHDAVYGTVDGAVFEAVDSAVDSAVLNLVCGAADSAVNGAVRTTVRDVVDSAVDGAVFEAVNDAVGGAVRDAVCGAVNGAVRTTVRDVVGSAVDGAVFEAVNDAVGGAVRDAVCGAVRRGWHYRMGGAMWAAWPAAWGTYVRDVCGLDPAPEALQAAEDVTECGWWWPHRDFVIVCDRPTRLCRDAGGQLHSEDGPAIQWADGWGIYSWHGTRVPAEWIEGKDTVDPSLALTHENAEQRRCLAEILGWDRVLEQLSPTVIDSDPDPQVGTLIEVVIPGSGRERFLRVKCGTGRRFALPVPPDVTTALDANAWTYGLTGTDLRGLEVRT